MCIPDAGAVFLKQKKMKISDYQVFSVDEIVTLVLSDETCLH